MKELQVDVPSENKEEVEEVLREYADDLSSSEVEKDERDFVEFNLTVDSDDIDGLTEAVKSVKEIKNGDLSIKVLKQESLIKKGQKTKGSSSSLSKEEIYSKAQEFQGFDRIQWSLVAISAAIAAYGLVFNNVIVVIGAMILAPLLSPLVSSSISLVVGDRAMMKESMFSSLKAFIMVVAVSFLVLLPIPVSSNELISMVVDPGMVTILLSVLVGSAAALTFAAGVRDQIAGVAVAIALVPPLASIGIGLKMANMSIVLGAAAISTVNILSVIISGFVTFYLIGLRPSSYYSQKQAEGMRKILGVTALALVVVAAGITYVSYESYQEYTFEQQLESEADELFGDRLLDVRKTGNGYQVIVLGNESQSLENYESLLQAEIVYVQTG